MVDLTKPALCNGRAIHHTDSRLFIISSYLIEINNVNVTDVSVNELPTQSNRQVGVIFLMLLHKVSK